MRAGTATYEAARGSQADEGGGETDAPTEEGRQEQATPEAKQADAEVIGTAAELIRRPRSELSSAEREVRDSLTYGDAFKALRSAAEAQGDSEAVTELDAVSEEVSAALEAETMARTRVEEADLEPIRQRLDDAAQRFTGVMERINGQQEVAGQEDQAAGLDMQDSPQAGQPGESFEYNGGNAAWEQAWQEQGVTSPEEGLPDTTVTINGEQAEQPMGLDMGEARAKVEQAATQTDTEPTPNQAQAGNYRKGKVRLNGFEIAIENPKGSTRRGTAPDGTEWESQMAHHYGDIKGTTAADGDNLDVFVGDNPEAPRAFIIDQVNDDGSFDEHKVMLGFDSLEEARQGYLANYDEGWQGLGEISEVPVDDLKGWVRDGAHDMPFSDMQARAEEETPAARVENGRLPGRTETTYLPDNTPLETQFRVMDAGQVRASNLPDGRENPDYDPDLQPRDRSGQNSQVQVRNIAANLNPERLGSNPEAGSGAPIIGPDGMVESGNGRFMAIQTAYQQGRGENYRRFVRQQAIDAGMDPAEFDAMEAPVLVRERQTEIDRADLGRRANDASAARMSPVETALADAERITVEDLALWQPDQSGDPLAASNRDFQRRFAQRIGENEAAGLRNPRTGRFTSQMSQRMTAAVMGRAYRDADGRPAADVVELVAEQSDQMRNLQAGLQAGAVDLAMAYETGDAAATETVNAIVDATRIVRRARDEGVSVRELVAQVDAFDGEVSPMARDMAVMINTNMRSQRAMTDAFRYIGEQTRINAESPAGSMFEDAPAPNTEEITRAGFSEPQAEAQDAVAGEPAGQDSDAGRPGESQREPSEGREADPADGAEEAQGVTLKADGQPFQTRRAVELSKRFRDTAGATPVEVEGGWGFTVQDAAREPAAPSQAEPDGDAADAATERVEEAADIRQEEPPRLGQNLTERNPRLAEQVREEIEVFTGEDATDRQVNIESRNAERGQPAEWMQDETAQEILADAGIEQTGQSSADTPASIATETDASNSDALNLTDPQTGQPLEGTGYRVDGIDPGRLYAGAQVPVMGPGTYVALEPSDARDFAGDDGAQVDEVSIRLEKPLVIRGDNEWAALTREAGWETPNPSMRSTEQTVQMTAGLQALAQERGHDGIAVLWHDDTLYDMDEVTGKPIKTLRNVFSKPQVVVFDTAQGDTLSLETQTEESLAAREQEVQSAVQAEAEQRRQEAERAQADRDADDFVLSGSDAAADQAMARGQDSLFAFAGERARTADPMALETAQQRLARGDDAEAVRRETGWFEGNDGKWRFEIDDSQAALLPTIETLAQGKREPASIDRFTYRAHDDGTYTVELYPEGADNLKDIVRLVRVRREVLDAMLPANAIQAVDQDRGVDEWEGMLDDAGLTVRDAPFQFRGFNALPMEQVLHHPRLFSAYPQLRNVLVQVDPGLGNGAAFLERADGSMAGIRLGRAQQLSSLLHEIQHGIQNIEGFATGGTPQGAGMLRGDAEYARQRVNEMRQQAIQGNEEAYREAAMSLPRGADIDSPARELMDDATREEFDRWSSILRDYRQRGVTNAPRDPMEAYRRLSGEVEARNVQARQGMGEAERQATPPTQTQDTADSDVIVVFNGEEMDSAPTPENTDAQPEGETQAPRAEDIRARLAGHPELSGVEVVQSARELPREVQLIMALQGVQGGDVGGVYNPDTGAPMIVADNLVDEADAIRKAVHEGVGHYGIRGLLGKELEPLMLEIYQSHTRSEGGRRNIEEIQQAYPFIDVTTRKGKITLSEELVAHYIEDSNGRPKLSQRIKSTIRRLLRKLFPGIQWRTSDILVMGDQARRWLRRQQAARDVGGSDNRYSFAERQSELSAQDLAAQLREEYPGLKLDLAGRGQKVTLSRIVAPEREQGTGSAVMRRLTDWADASGRTLALTPSNDFGGNVKRLREFYRRFGFVENKGRNKDYAISEAMYREPDPGVGDVRFSLNRQQGTAAGKFSNTDSTNFGMPDEGLRDAALRKMADKMRPLKILEEAIRRTGRDIEEEADAYLAEELFHGKVEYDLRQLREQYVEPLAEGLAKAKISQADLDDYLYSRHAPERNATIAERNPDDPEMQDGGSGMTNAQAAEIIERVANSGKQAEYDRLAQFVYDMTRLRREAIREGGLEDDAVVDAWESAWQYYVPLKGNAADEPGRPRTGRGFEISGRESRIAAGRKSLADSPSSQVIVDVNESLIRRRKNEVAQSLLSLVTDNPNPALWEVFTDDNPDTQRTPTRVTDPETGQTRIEVQERPVNMTGNDRYFKAKRAGRTYYLKIHDERLMNAMRNVGPENNGTLIRAASAVTRVMSSLMTSYNPEFMLTNFARDVQTALLNLTAEQTRDDGKIKGEAIVRQTARDIGPSMRAAWRGMQGKQGKNDGSREWDQWFREFQEDGAKTGYFDMKDLNAQAKEIQSMIRRADGTTLSHMLKARKKTADFVENMNGAVENAVRLSAYANARRAGISRKKAASLAKNMTVNFNRRGEAGTALNAAYMFANASIQGTMNFARTMVTVKNTPEGKSPMNVWARMNTAQKLGLGMASGAFLLGMLNRWVSEEDEDGVLFYDKIPDYEKERSLIFMSSLWGGEPDDYVKIPLPYGYNVFSVVGTHAEAVTAGSEKPAEAAKNLVLAVLGSFSPIGFEDSDEAHSLFLKNLTPTIFRSITQIGVNEKFSGRPIYREDFPFGTPTPDSSRSFRSTPEAYKSFAQFLNEFTGGTDNISGAMDINPDVMQHLVNYYGGGAWGFVEKTADFAKRAATGEEVERYRVPFAGRFASNVSPYRDQGLFYERRDELGQIANEAESLKGRERIDFRRDHRQELRLFNRAKDLEKRLTDLRKRRDRVQETETLSDEAKKRRVEMIEKQMKRWVDDFNQRYNEIE